MANNPKATTVVQDAAGAIAGGLDVVCVLAPVAQNADIKPRLFGSADAIAALHGYSEGLEYCDLHATRTGKAFLFLGLPISVQGAVGRVDKSGNSGSSVASITPGASGILAEHDGAVRVVKGGIVGTDQIELEYSFNGGRKYVPVRIGTANSYALPFFGAVLGLGAGTLVAGDVIVTWHGSAPRSDSAAWIAARQALAQELNFFRSMVLVQDVQDSDEAAVYRDQLNAYETENERFVYGRCNIADRLPQAEMSHTLARMQGNPNLTFAEVGASADTVTRSSGSWIADGFAVGMWVVITGTAGNNVSGVIASLSATVLTFGTTPDLAAEGPVGNVTVVAYPALTFAEVGGTGDTITRSHGSWVTDGFRAGDRIEVAGSGSNNFTDALVTAVTAAVLTLDTQDLVAEVASSAAITVTAGQTEAAWMAAQSAEFADINSVRINIAAGRAWVTSSYSGWLMRRPAMWFMSAREYQHDLHIPTWAKELGDLGVSITDENKLRVEWDDRACGNAGSAARFSTLKTWANGPTGVFVAQDLTRNDEARLSSKQHNAAVINLACTINQLNSELIIGKSLILNGDARTASSASLSTQKQRMDAALKRQLLTDLNGEGPRASNAVWVPSKDDDFSVPEPTLTAVMSLTLNGTVFNVLTKSRVNAAA